MDAVGTAATVSGMPKEAAHFERFAPPETASGAPAGSFTVVLHRSGQRINVPPEQSMLEALEHANVCIPFSCREGMCRSCELPLISGEADHRDFVLSDQERDANTCMLPCVSRARSSELVVDL